MTAAEAYTKTMKATRCIIDERINNAAQQGRYECVVKAEDAALYRIELLRDGYNIKPDPECGYNVILSWKHAAPPLNQ